MSRCLRICGAYSYRLTRKHSTIFLITTFILTLTVIFQLYAFKHQDVPHFSSRVGDFEYKAGSFLRGQLPNANVSYCQFNYGLPNTLKWKEIEVSPSPELGSHSIYRVIYDAVQGAAYANYSKYNAVTYATQATPEFIYHIVEIARHWDGPISLALFVPSYDLDTTMQTMNQLCQCYSGMAKVSLHLFFPKRHPPKLRDPSSYILTTEIPTTTIHISIEELLKRKIERYKNLTNETRAQYVHWVRKRKIEKMMANLPKIETTAPNLIFPDCSGLEVFDFPTFRQEMNMIYPINVGRNVARNASRTNYFIVSDIELVPSEGLATKFLALVRKLMGNKKRDRGSIFSKTVFVVPLFEVEKGVEMPRDKSTLVRLINENRAKYFHQKVCAHCQRFPGLQSWLIRPAPNGVERGVYCLHKKGTHELPLCWSGLISGGVEPIFMRLSRTDKGVMELQDFYPGTLADKNPPMLIARREYPYHRWEPLYFGTRNEPWYSESLSWEGRQDKMTQMLEMCLQEYRMVVLDGAFLCHAATTRNGSRNNRAERANHRRYQAIIASFKRKYQNRPKCKLMYGC